MEQNHPQTNKIGKVSFIVTCYNVPTEMLTECIQSILNLSLSNGEREIILVDDGSFVSPLNELQQYEDHLIYIRQPNRGVSEARNAGIRMATGTYIQFIDGDDYLLTAPYEHCLDMARYCDPDVVLYDMTKKENGGATNEFAGPVSGSEYMLHNNLHGSVWCCLFKRELLVGLRFTKGQKYVEDEEFLPQLLLGADRLFYTASQAYFYRQHSASVLHRTTPEDKQERLDDHLKVIFRLSHLAERMSPLEKEALRRRVAQLTMDYIYNVMTLTRDSRYLEECIGKLYERGLFPLPDKKYTRKYTWFRRMTSSPARRKVLCKLIPRLS